MGKRSTFALMMTMLFAIGAFVYLSPAAPTAQMRAAARSATVAAQNASATSGVPETSSTSGMTRAQQRKARANARPGGKDRLDGQAKTETKSKTKTVVVHENHTIVKTVAATTPPATAPTSAPAAVDPTAPPVPHDPTCTSFKWQQDAQAAYVQNLADPYGLDGPVGPNDDDGIACSLLPVDTTRPASTPAGAKPAEPPPPPQPEPLPTAPTMEALLAPEHNYFGVSTPQAPFDWKE
jgi:mannan endo-1,4-beta-mannosidase